MRVLRSGDTVTFRFVSDGRDDVVIWPHGTVTHVAYGTDITTAWVMLAGAGKGEHAQDGWADWDAYTVNAVTHYQEYFDQTMMTTYYATRYLPSAPVTDGITYTFVTKLDYVSGYGWRWLYYMNGVEKESVPVDWSDINSMQVAEELHEYGSQMPGTNFSPSYAKEAFTGLYKRTGYDYYGTSTWFNMNANYRGFGAVINGIYQEVQPPTSSHFGIQDGGSSDQTWFYGWDKCQ